MFFKKYKQIDQKLFEQDKKIYKAYKMIVDENEKLEKRICELERIVNNQPLIKKYQKTLDIFLKNAQD